MNTEPLTEETALARAKAYIKTIQSYPSTFSGRGVVICGGGLKHFPNAWVCINMLRRFGCKLPIQLWHLGEQEMTDEMRALVSPLGVECVDGLEIRKCRPARILRGWELKAYSVLHCPFKEVLLLDADNVPVTNPEFLFESQQFKDAGAIFWPDYGRLERERQIWELCGVEYKDEPEVESGQVVVDKQRCWRALCLAMWYNEFSDFYYKFVHGDKETFHIAFRKMGQPYAMPEKGIHTLPATMCQHDFEGRRLFQHRNLAKWKLIGDNRRINGFLYEDECLQYLNELRRLWRERPGINDAIGVSRSMREAATQIVSIRFLYHRVGFDRRPMTFLENGLIGEGSAGCEAFWNLKDGPEGVPILEIRSDSDITCRLQQDQDSVWRGRWLVHEQMPIELIRDGTLSGKRAGLGKKSATMPPAPSLFLVSLPRSLSCFLYRVIRRATGLREPTWTSDGEILNVDRYALLPAARYDAGRKFIKEDQEPRLFAKLTEFLDEVVAPAGYAYKDVVQPFVVADWIRRKGFRAIKIKRSITDVAYSMLHRHWHYPRRLFPETNDLEYALVQGLVSAQTTLDSISAEEVDFDELIFDELKLQHAISGVFCNAPLSDVRYIDAQFEGMRTEILNRRQSEKYQQLADTVSRVTGAGGAVAEAVVSGD